MPRPVFVPPAAEEFSGENFAELLSESPGGSGLVGKTISGKVVSIENDCAVVDVGLKAEGRIQLREFRHRNDSVPSLGDIIEVFVERMENRHGEVSLSRERAQHQEAWDQIEKLFAENKHAEGVITQRVKGGFTVDLSGAIAFLPGSQIDVRPVRDSSALMGSRHFFQILKMDRVRGNIVVSRRAVLEESRARQRNEIISTLREGQEMEGVVKNITEYGAFIDLGGVDGLLHVTDIAWKRIGHPSEMLQIGQTVRVQVVRFNPSNQRISLGMKQLEKDPWENVAEKYPVNTRTQGQVTNITEYGAFVELEPGVEGLIHVSEMSWTRKNISPGEIVSVSEQIEICVLNIDTQKRRISLGLKQCLPNPWQAFLEKHPVGSEIEGQIRNITEFGLFLSLPGDVDGMVYMSDIDWEKNGEEALNKHQKGERVRAKILDVNIEKERISMGIKQLTPKPESETALDSIKRGSIVTCTIKNVTDSGLEVVYNDSIAGFIKRSELARSRTERRLEDFGTGEKVDAKIISVSRARKLVFLSIKALEIEEEKNTVENYGSADSGASLGDILGAAIEEKKSQSEKHAQAQVGENKTRGQEKNPEQKKRSENTGKEKQARAALLASSEGADRTRSSEESPNEPPGEHPQNPPGKKPDQTLPSEGADPAQDS